MKRVIFITLGFIFLGLGTLGIPIPVLPTVPFYLLTTFCFARSSERLDRWFQGTKLYQDNLASYVAGRGMTVQTKLKIILSVTFGMGIGLFFMLRKELYIPCIILTIIWICLMFYFIFVVKNFKE